MTIKMFRYSIDLTQHTSIDLTQYTKQIKCG